MLFTQRLIAFPRRAVCHDVNEDGAYQVVDVTLWSSPSSLPSSSSWPSSTSSSWLTRLLRKHRLVACDKTNMGKLEVWFALCSKLTDNENENNQIVIFSARPEWRLCYQRRDLVTHRKENLKDSVNISFIFCSQPKYVYSRLILKYFVTSWLLHARIQCNLNLLTGLVLFSI